MESAFGDYAETIRLLKERDRLDDAVKLMLLGRLLEASTHGAPTMREADELCARVDPDFATEYRDAIALSSSGYLNSNLPSMKPAGVGG